MGWLDAILGRRGSSDVSPEQRRAESLNKKAMNLIVRGKLAEAERMLQTALKVAPSMASLHHNLGAVYLNQKKYDTALKSLRRAVQLDPQDVESKIAIAKTYGDMGRADAALSEYRRICAAAPWDWRAQISLGNALVERGELDEAMGYLEKAVELKPKEELAHLVLAVALERKGDLDRAIGEYREVHRTSILGSNRKAAADKVKELEKRKKKDQKEGREG